MDSQRTDFFLMVNAKYFESYHLPQIREQLLRVDDSRTALIQMLQFKDPTMTLVISILAGALGVDRFIIGDVGLGVGKLLTCGGFGIWAIIDWFLIGRATKEKNLEMLRRALM